MDGQARPQKEEQKKRHDYSINMGLDHAFFKKLRIVLHAPLSIFRVVLLALMPTHRVDTVSIVSLKYAKVIFRA